MNLSGSYISFYADDYVRRRKSNNRNCRCIEEWSFCDESNAESNVSVLSLFHHITLYYHFIVIGLKNR